MTHKEREELNSLSLRAFGASSKWKKLMDKGVYEPFERQREVMVPTANGKLVKKTFTDHKYVVKHYTVEEVKKLMLDILKLNKTKEEFVDAIQTVDTGNGIPEGSTVVSTEVSNG